MVRNHVLLFMVGASPTAAEKAYRDALESERYVASFRMGGESNSAPFGNDYVGYAAVSDDAIPASYRESRLDRIKPKNHDKLVSLTASVTTPVLK